MTNPATNAPTSATPRIIPLASRNLTFEMGISSLNHNGDLIPMASAIITDYVTPTTKNPSSNTLGGNLHHS